MFNVALNSRNDCIPRLREGRQVSKMFFVAPSVPDGFRQRVQNVAGEKETEVRMDQWLNWKECFLWLFLS